MEDSSKIMLSSSSQQKSSEASKCQASNDRRKNLELVLDTEQTLSPDDNIMGVKTFTPSVEKKPEQPEANVQSYRRLTPQESLEKIKADMHLKSMRLRFKFTKRQPKQ
jgi:hypothetical protein